MLARHDSETTELLQKSFSPKQKCQKHILKTNMHKNIVSAKFHCDSHFLS